LRRLASTGDDERYRDAAGERRGFALVADLPGEVVRPGSMGRLTRAAESRRAVLPTLNVFNLASGLRSRTVDRRRDLPPSPR